MRESVNETQYKICKARLMDFSENQLFDMPS